LVERELNKSTYPEVDTGKYLEKIVKKLSNSLTQEVDGNRVLYFGYFGTRPRDLGYGAAVKLVPSGAWPWG
jgi:hypothetical protein